MFTLNEMLRWRSNVHPDLLALIDERGDQVTYRELYERSLDCGRRWRQRGVSAGQVVAVLDTNSVANLINMFGLARIGARPALLNWRLTAQENQGLFELTKPVAVISHPALVDRLPADLPNLRVLLGSVAENIEGIEDLEDGGWVVDEPTSGTAIDVALPDEPIPGDVFVLAFSSGTTGLPKGIPLRHEALARSTMVDSADIRGMHQGARHLLVAPIFHLAGLANALMGLARGAEVYLRASFDPGAVLDDIERLGIDYMTAVPAMFRAMVLAAGERATPPDTASMLEMTYGASPIPAELVRQVQELFPTAGLRQFYGMTEIGGALTTLTPKDHDPASPHQVSAGRVNPGYEVRLIDSEGHDVADGEPGQILIRGASVMHGYWDDPTQTESAFLDGWFLSGDVAVRDDGYLTVMDRVKDMIVSGGENVYPAEVEAVLYSHPDLVDVAVIGVADDTFGERVHAVVVSKVDPAPALDVLQAFCRERLAGFKLPRSMEIVTALPRNSTGKVLKGALRQAVAAEK